MKNQNSKKNTLKSGRMRAWVLFFAVPAIAFAMLVTACSSAPKEVGNVARGEPKPTTVASIEAKQVAAEQEAAYVTEIDFAKNSARLTSAARSKIESLYKMADPSRLKSVKVIAWADQEYPKEPEKKLGFGDRELAKHRGEAVQNLIKEKNPKLDLELYNMAQRPGTFSEFVGSADARIKKSLEHAGQSTSKARKVIVMLLLDEKLAEKL